MRLIISCYLLSLCLVQIQGQEDSLQLYFEKGLQLKAQARTAEAITMLQTASTFTATDSLSAEVQHQLANLHYKNREYEQAISYWKKAIVLRTHFLPANHVNIIKTYINIGNTENILGQPKNARMALSLALDLLNNKDTNDQFRKANVYAALGGLEKNELNLTVARDYLERAHELYGACERNIGWRMVNTSTDLFDVLKLLKKPQEALHWAELALGEVLAVNTSTYQHDHYLANALSNRGLAYNLNQQNKKAEKDYLHALKLNLKQPDRIEYAGVTFNNLIALYNDMNHIDKAESVITQAKTIFGTADQAQLLANTLMEEARFRYDQGDYQTAITAYKKALKALSSQQSSSKISELIRSAVNESTIIDLITGQLKTTVRLYQQSQNRSLLMETEAQINEIVNSVDSLHVGIIDLGSKLEIAGLVNEFFDVSLHIKYLLYRETKHKKYALEAWQLMEKAKSRSILDDIRSDEASEQSDVLSSLYQKRKMMQDQISQLTTKTAENQDSILAWQNAVGRVTNQIDSLINMDKVLVSLMDQGKIGQLIPQTLVMQYHLARDSSFMISVYNEVIEFYCLGGTPELINTLHDFISEVRNPASTEATFSTPAYASFQLLFPQKAANELATSTIIIPDGLIGKLPFEALLVQPNSENKGFSNLDYLLKYTHISYASSHSILGYQLKEKHVVDKALGFAISYRDFPVGNYNILAQSTQELQSLKGLAGAETFEETKATKDMFLQEAPHASFIHLSLHGIVSTERPSQSYLQFYPTSSQDEGRVYLKDIYHKQINPDMIILSSCSSGDGYLSEADGAISFAHAFSYSQAKAILLNLWDSASSSSHQLVQGYYAGITAQLSNSEALGQSKLNYLTSIKAPELAHPFYWASLVLYGDPTSLRFSKKISLLPLVPILLIAFYFIFRRIRAASSA